MTDKDLLDLERLKIHREQLEKEGYTYLRVVEGRGICGLYQFIFTVGLCEGIATNGFDTYEGRYCYPHQYSKDALMALLLWDGKQDPKGRWIKYKGKWRQYNREPDQFQK